MDSLVLAHNQLSKVPANVFSHLTLLNSLELEGNQIFYVDKDAFSGLEGKPFYIHRFGVVAAHFSFCLQKICSIYDWAITIFIKFQVIR